MLVALLVTIFVNHKEAQQDMEDDQPQASGQHKLQDSFSVGQDYGHDSLQIFPLCIAFFNEFPMVMASIKCHNHGLTNH